MPETVAYAELSWPEAERRVAQGAPIFLPLGATEQHGRHMSMNVDVVLPTALCERVAQKVGGLVMNRDQVVLGHEHVVLSKLDCVIQQHACEKYDERVAAILLELWPLVLVFDVFDRQVVEAEHLLQQVQVIVVWTLDVQPEPILMADLEAGGDCLVARIVERSPFGSDQRPHVRPTVVSSAGEQIP